MRNDGDHRLTHDGGPDHDGAPRERHDDARAEDDELPRALIVRTMVLTVALGTCLSLAAYVLLRARLADLRPSNLFPERSLPAPREISGVRQELFRVANPRPTIRDRQRAALETFGWSDEKRRRVHIPIETAMDLLARENAAKGAPP